MIGRRIRAFRIRGAGERGGVKQLDAKQILQEHVQSPEFQEKGFVTKTEQHKDLRHVDTSQAAVDMSGEIQPTKVRRTETFSNRKPNVHISQQWNLVADCLDPKWRNPSGVLPVYKQDMTPSGVHLKQVMSTLNALKSTRLFTVKSARQFRKEKKVFRPLSRVTFANENDRTPGIDIVGLGQLGVGLCAMMRKELAVEYLMSVSFEGTFSDKATDDKSGREPSTNNSLRSSVAKAVEELVNDVPNLMQRKLDRATTDKKGVEAVAPLDPAPFSLPSPYYTDDDGGGGGGGGTPLICGITPASSEPNIIPTTLYRVGTSDCVELSHLSIYDAQLVEFTKHNFKLYIKCGPCFAPQIVHQLSRLLSQPLQIINCERIAIGPFRKEHCLRFKAAPQLSEVLRVMSESKQHIADRLGPPETLATRYGRKLIVEDSGLGAADLW